MSLILSGTDGLSDVDGSAATPAIRGTDANTGIFFPAADTIAFAEGGVEAMRIDSSGRVGIGLTSYNLPLSIVADGNGQNIQINGRTGDDFGQIFFRNFGGANNLARIASDSNAGLVFGTGSQTAPTVPTERMRIDSSGDVLIGVSATTPVWDERLGVRLDTTGTGQVAFGAYAASTSYASSMIRVQAENATGTAWNILEGRGNVGGVKVTIDGDGKGTFLGGVVVNGVNGLGYGTGSGGTVTQATSRTTAVTINKPTGKITMFTAAGSTTPAQFTVNNSLITATDVVVLSIQGGVSNFYDLYVQAMSAGSFNIVFRTTSGVASDTPVINFAIIKGAIA